MQKLRLGQDWWGLLGVTLIKPWQLLVYMKTKPAMGLDGLNLKTHKFVQEMGQGAELTR